VFVLVTNVLKGKNMKPGVLISSLMIVTVLLLGCNSKREKSEAKVLTVQPQANDSADGEHSFYDKDGNLQYIVEYRNKKTNGRVRQFYPDGKLYMDAVYKDGFRNGKCTYFFKNGKPFTVSNYENGNKEGIETKYYQDGKLLSVNTYKKNNVLPGLIEYEKDGKEIINTVNLVIKKTDPASDKGKYYFHISLSDIGITANFFASAPLESGKNVKLKMSGNEAVFEVPVSDANYSKKKLVFEALFLTPKGNSRRLQKSYNFDKSK
jgi:hypothetical protein